MSFQNDHVFLSDTWKEIADLGMEVMLKARSWAGQDPAKTAELERSGKLIEALKERDWP